MLYFIPWLLIRALCLYVPYKMAFLLATIFQEYVCVLSHVWLFAPPWTVALQALLSEWAAISFAISGLCGNVISPNPYLWENEKGLQCNIISSKNP